MANHPSLKDARQKLEWTKDYLRELDRALESFRQSKPYSLITDNNPDTRENIVRARLTTKVDPNIQQLVSLIVTDLRSALHYMICELAVLTDGNANRSGVEFPIARDRQEFEKSATQGKIKRLPLPVRDAICRLQPYKEGYSGPIWAMNELRRKGIYHSLIPMGHAATGLGPMLLKAGPTGSVRVGMPVWTSPDDEPVVLTSTGAGNEYNVTLVVDICLADIDGFERKPVLPFLYECAKRVTGVVTHFDRAFFPKT